MSMSRDGLLPPAFGRISPRFKTPGFATIVSGLFVGLTVLFVDDKLMTDLTSIGTLFAFVLVCGGVLYLPKLIRGPGKFSIPYLNGKYIIRCFIGIFSLFFRASYHRCVLRTFPEILPGNFISIIPDRRFHYLHFDLHPQLFRDPRARRFILPLPHD